MPLLGLTAALAMSACTAGRGVPPFYEIERDLPGGVNETRAALGLGLQREFANGARESALRPLLSWFEDTDGSKVFEAVPPVVRRQTDDAKEKTTVLPLFFQSSYGTPEQREAGESDDDTALFPLLAWGDEPGQGSYFLGLPVGGTLKGKLLTDEIETWGFPAYVHTQSDGWESTSVLWPLINWGEGNGRRQLRVLPFWSESHTPRGSHRAALWPIFHWNTETRNDRTQNGWFVFPLAGHKAAEDGSAEQWTFLYPLFQFARDDKTGSSYTGAPWPLYKRSIQPGESDSEWFWPFYGRYDSEKERSRFYLWPIGWDQEEVRGSVKARRQYVIPFWMRSETGPVDGPVTAETLRSYPLFAYRRHEDGYEELRVPELIPFFGWNAGETVYSDLVNLFHWRRDAEGREAWDGPLGIVRYRRRESGEAALTLLWWIEVPLGGGE